MIHLRRYVNLIQMRFQRFSSKNLIIIIVVFGAFVRLVALCINRDNNGTYFGHSANIAEVAIQFAENNNIGVLDRTQSKIIHGAFISAGKLVDPEDLNLNTNTKADLVIDYENEIGLPLITGLVWKFTEMRFIYVQLIQVAIDVLCIYLIFAGTLFLTGQNVAALVSGLGYSLFIPQIYLVTFPAPYAWVTFSSVIFFYLVSRILYSLEEKETDRYKIASFFAVLGLIAGIASLIRSSTVLYLIFCLAFLFFLIPWRKMIVFGSIALICQVAVLSPLLVRNYDAFGKVMVSRGVFWHSILAGMGAHENPWGLEFDDHKVAAFVLKDNPGVEKFGVEYEEIAKTKVLNVIREHPSWYLKVIIERIWRIVFPGGIVGVLVAGLFCTAVLGFLRAHKEKMLRTNRLLVMSSVSIYFFVSTIAIIKPSLKYVYPGYVYLIVLSSLSVPSLFSTLNKTTAVDLSSKGRTINK